jgi:hypothetical protein
MNKQEILNLRSLEFGKAICIKLKQAPDLIQIARNNIQRWEKEGNMSPALKEWKTLLYGSRQRIYEIMTGTDSESQRIRSSNPFAGVLTEEERQKIHEKYIPIH